MTVLTPRQDQVLTALTEHVEAKGYPPTVRELGEQVGLTSSSSVVHHLRELQEMGYITRDPGSPRAITLLTRRCEICSKRISGGPICTDCWQSFHDDTDLPGATA